MRLRNGASVRIDREPVHDANVRTYTALSPNSKRCAIFDVMREGGPADRKLRRRAVSDVLAFARGCAEDE